MGTGISIAYFTTVYPSVSHTFIRREIQELERQGMRVVRFSLRPYTSDLKDPQDQEEFKKTSFLLSMGKIKIIGIFLYYLLFHSVAFFRAFYLAVGMWRKSDRSFFIHLAYLVEACLFTHLCRKYSIDHIHVHFGTNVTAVARLVRYLGGPTYSFTVHGPDELDSPKALDLKGKIEDSLFTVAITDFCSSQLKRWCPYEHWKKIKIIHCGVDSSFLSNYTSYGEEKYSFVTVGRLSAQKGIPLLIQSFIEVVKKDKNATLVLVGDGEMRGEIEEQIRNFSLEKNVQITGYVSEEKVRSYIAASRVMVMPSFAEGLPMVIMESYAVGRPVISTYIAGIPELVIDKYNGWLVPSGNPEILSQAMAESLECEISKLEGMAKKGNEMVKERHNISLEIQRLSDIFKQYVVSS